MSTPVRNERGIFIAFEGGEGAGKTTQSTLLRDRLEARGSDVVVTREPGGTEPGQQIRRLLLSPDTGDLDPRTEVLLYAADRAEHLNRVVRPALDAGSVLISDRYVDSTYAYQGAGRALELNEVKALMGWATGELVPDLTILLDVDPEAGLGRFTERDRIEAAGIDFHHRVRQGFLDLAAAEPGRYLVLDARESVTYLGTAIFGAVSELLAARSGAARGDSGAEIRPGRRFEHAVITTGLARSDGPEGAVYEITEVTTDGRVLYGPAQRGQGASATLWIELAQFEANALGAWID